MRTTVAGDWLRSVRSAPIYGVLWPETQSRRGGRPHPCRCRGLLKSALRSVWITGLLLVWLPVAQSQADEAITLEVAPAKTRQYEKIEFTIGADARYANPFDPGEVDVSLEITAPGGKRFVLPAFWCQPYQRQVIDRGGRKTDWIYPAGPPGWKARFAPMEIGTHTAVARLKDRKRTARSSPVRFEAAASNSKGFIRVSRRDPRFLEFGDGQPFFAIGQNLAFIGPAQFVKLWKAEDIFGKLSTNGANFLRIWTCCQDWALAIEARKSAWGRSWAPKRPLVPVPNRENDPAAPKCVKVSDRNAAFVTLSAPNPLAVRPDTRYVLTGRMRTEGKATVRISTGSTRLGEPVRSQAQKQWTAFKREFTTSPGQLWIDRITFRQDGSGAAWMDAVSLREARGGPELLWEAAVNRPVRGFYNPTDCFMLDELVETGRRKGVYLQLCLITRDLYIKSLKDPKSDEYARAIHDAKKLLRYAVARWGYSTSVAAWEYFNENNPSLPTDPFYDALGKHLEEIDIYGHLRATSAWSPAPKDWRHRRLDVPQLHHYLRPADKQRARDAVTAIIEQTALVKKHAPRRPVLLGEFGLAEDNWQRNRYMKQDKDLIHFHNSLWASAMSGACGTTMFWWWEVLDAMDAYRHYRPLAEFLRDVPFTTSGLKNTGATASNPLRVPGLQGKDSAYLWLSDPRSTWWNIVVGKNTPPKVRGATLEIPGLTPGSYRVTWWDTRLGKTVKETKSSAGQGTLRLRVPTFSRDIACKISLSKH